MYATEQFEKVCCRLGCPVEVTGSETGDCGIHLELKPALGVRVEDFLKIANDIALQLGVYYMQVIPPGNGSWKLQVNLLPEKPAGMSLAECLNVTSDGGGKLCVCLGSDVVGKPVVLDLEENPHLLIVGANADGKASLTEALAAQVGANAGEGTEIIRIKTESALETLQKITEREVGSAPCFVIIDEFAKLLRAYGEAVEDCIARLTMKSVAAGIHVLLGTEYPAVDVVSGVIKYGFPAKIAFRLSSKVESRTAIDVAGAEELAGPQEALIVTRSAKNPQWIRTPDTNM